MGMASIDRQADGCYLARWREYPGGPQRTKRFRLKRDAELYLDAIRGDPAHRVSVDPASRRTLFRHYAEQWRAGQVHRQSTAAQAESHRGLNRYEWSRSLPPLSVGQRPVIRRTAASRTGRSSSIVAWTIACDVSK